MLHRAANPAVRATVQRLALLLVLSAPALALFGCEQVQYKPRAVGREGEVLIVVDSSYWSGAVGEALQAELGQYIGTLPQPERTFELVPVALAGSDETLRRQKNLVFVAPLDGDGSVARFLKARLPEGAVDEMGSDNGIFAVRPDLWRDKQLVVYLAAADQDALVNLIHQRGDDLRYAFNRATRTRVTEDMFDRGRQSDLEEEILDEHGFTVSMQHDYFIAYDSLNFAPENTVWLRRNLSDTWRSLLIHYWDDVSPAALSPEWVYTQQDSLMSAYLTRPANGFPSDGYPVIDFRRPVETEEVNFLGRFGYETRGLWDMVGEGPGDRRFQFGEAGPFVTYTFYDEPTARVYMMIGMVYAPGYQKREFLRQMEVIAHTFRTPQDAEGEQALAASP